MNANRHPLSTYLAMEYPYTVVPDDGSYFIEFPDLPGCMTQVEEAAEIAGAAEEIRSLWIETEYEDGASIPEPAMQSEYSGRFVMRIPKQLHKELAIAAKQQDMSLNTYATYLLSSRTVSAEMHARLDRIEQRVASINDHLPYHVDRQQASMTSKELRTQFKLVVAV